eukprot:gene33641-41506_t
MKPSGASTLPVVPTRWLLGAALTLLVALAQAAPEMQRVKLPLPSGTVLQAHWLPAPQSVAPAQPSAKPAVLALHGCGGLYAKGGALSSRYRETAETLHAAGYAVLMPDSFGSRGLRDVCQTRYSDRTLNVSDRVQDARAALVWLAAQPGVDAQRIGVMGWSNGGTRSFMWRLTVLVPMFSSSSAADMPPHSTTLLNTCSRRKSMSLSWPSRARCLAVRMWGARWGRPPFFAALALENPMSFVNIEKPAAGAEGPRMDAEWLDAHWMPYTANRQFKANPRMIVEGSGAYYTDSEGRKIFDGLSGHGALGHGPIASGAGLRTMVEGALTAAAVLLLTLWVSAAIESRLLRSATGAELSLRKAVSNALRAVMIFFGLIVAMSAVGIDLTALSVLGGAVGVGIGLGLQKLAANYVSGFVILTERSMRIGDNVRVDNFEGRITNINARYTVVRSAAGRESIVPNEMLITQRVENLSLADPRVWLSTVVSVAYDSDVDLVIQLLTESALASNRVLRDPVVPLLEKVAKYDA